MTELLIDFDRGLNCRTERQATKELLKRLRFLRIYFPLDHIGIFVAKTSKGWHHYVSFNMRMTRHEILACQAILGDDWRRAALNLNRLRKNLVFWNKLFRDKWKGASSIGSERPVRYVRLYHGQ